MYHLTVGLYLLITCKCVHYYLPLRASQPLGIEASMSLIMSGAHQGQEHYTENIPQPVSDYGDLLIRALSRENICGVFKRVNALSCMGPEPACHLV